MARLLVRQNRILRGSERLSGRGVGPAEKTRLENALRTISVYIRLIAYA